MTALAKSLPQCGIVIVGGTSGVGLASAVLLARAKVRGIVLVGRTEARGTEAVRMVRDAAPECDVTFVVADAGTLGGAGHAVAQAQAALGTIDVLINSTASNYVPDLLIRTDPADIEAILLRQVLPPMYMTRLVLPIMREAGTGSIVNIASDAGKTATPGETIVGAAMAAIVMFSRTAAMEAKRDGIRVNVLTPSLIQGTPTAELVTRGGFSARLFEKAAAMAHLGVADPEDLANLILFLAGPESRRLTGQAISVNGGISAA